MGSVLQPATADFVAAGPRGAVLTARAPPEPCPQHFLKMLQPPAVSLQRFKDRGDTLAAADAERRRAIAQIVAA